MADSTTILGALLSTTCSSYAKASAPSKTFTISRITPRGPTGSTCQTILRAGRGPPTAPFTGCPPVAETMPPETSCSNSASVIPGGDSRMLTPEIPADVCNSKSGGIGSVACEPVQAEAAIDPKIAAASLIRIVVISQLHHGAGALLRYPWPTWLSSQGAPQRR